MDYKNDTYEEQVASYKQRLFERLHALTPSLNAVVVELGIGCFPNAIYYTGWDVQVLGLELDTSKHAEAMSLAWGAHGLREPDSARRERAEVVVELGHGPQSLVAAHVVQRTLGARAI